ncbi:MAG: bifunctional histidinol-phosphatase/imidazoleglycerol-phosphate dehydratase HisB [Acidobacteria bacterium]|nr:MAG: bifunctional histidinol-phosphatase/imidazoleglycerol-phosphate dehydratase HisB [Acidobacteriota bacterium]REK03004.1 MAG: bifunctional histidinol-phosphatase/imidazoleglycerol-phosphate dehydratase HisB [Acidobacteriota bacterium]REK13192.1 MAG: bifunctional histidinol-phosphatase/imidazoleglycerol-phosphate dehydratase HisB [Acidobacteriota bacterium]REK41186.1 MAG: bifunctional histidinol-phosphatase/imidazoleglycerol-phosphate dehydratase HisB [Acidobacteriota bacterium]
MKKALFIDRDGTLIEEPEDFQVDSFGKLRFKKGVLKWLGKIASETDFVLVIVTNQDGLGTESFPEDDFLPVQDLMLRIFESEGISFDDVLIDKTFEHENAPTRKPKTGLLKAYTGDPQFDLSGSWVIGDRASDVQLAKNLGARSIFIEGPNFKIEEDDPKPDETVRSWEEIYRLITGRRRIAETVRKTNETDIRVRIDLDGKGDAEISTGIRFFDHMLEQVAKHAGFDLKIEAVGDLDVDEHHTIEDVAIALGETFLTALGDRRGIGRYGFTLPMDDCLAQVAVDLGGRNWCVWEANFDREMIGGMPTEMFFHFFKSFSDKALCNLNIKAEGTNEHHKIEAIFKAFARSLKMASRKDSQEIGIPSTKGSL